MKKPFNISAGRNIRKTQSGYYAKIYRGNEILCSPMCDTIDSAIRLRDKMEKQHPKACRLPDGKVRKKPSDYYKARKAAGLCTCCARPNDRTGKILCSECAAAQKLKDQYRKERLCASAA